MSAAATNPSEEKRPALSELHIEAFRGLRDVKLEGLGRFNLLVGGNNSGKTSVLEAIALLARPFDSDQWKRIANRRAEQASVVDNLWSLFPTNDMLVFEGGYRTTLRPIVVRAGYTALRVAATARPDALLGLARPNEGETAVIDLHVSDPIRQTIRFDTNGTVAHDGEDDELEGNSPALANAFVQQGTREAEVIGYVDLVTSRGRKGSLLDVLRLFDPEIEGLDHVRPRGRSMLMVTHRRRRTAPLGSFGAGMRRALAMAAALVRSQSGILLVDELEEGIHRQRLDEVTRWLAKAADELNVQVFVTTHSSDAVGAVIDAYEGTNDLVAFHLRRNDGGNIVAGRFDADLLRHVRETGMDIR